MSVRQRHTGYKLQGLESIQSLVFVSRIFHDELLNYCFSRFNFFLHNGSESIRWVAREFYRQIGVENRKLVKYITIPSFSIDLVMMNPDNMIELFAVHKAFCLELLDEMQRVFALLARFPALEELDLGIDSLEAVRLTDRMHCNIPPPSTSRADLRRERGLMYATDIRDALQEARFLPARVTIGIWWTTIGQDRTELRTDEEIRQDQEDFLHRVREDIMPVRVICKGVM
ncbi:uncharacterized protein J4E92_008694 [Alternaria infectoria]|uniref:uncharacterized protein n=1 Tax=Alternaria infectoria TaxID=45303 RepID=UPI00222007E2|nr:uncharacterized protein J4E92_008694 [Alternaria infectoria]KAI4919050.1 hypothetical protein J4E92_008694 [Alternaria infectoria]